MNEKPDYAAGRRAFSDADLYGADLRCADLHGADLRAADLGAANLYAADLRCADLRDADLRCADLGSADLRAANLYAADLYAADLYAADLRGADLRGADLRCADLRGANLDGADLCGADLRAANLYGADLRAAKSLVNARGIYVAYAPGMEFIYGGIDAEYRLVLYAECFTGTADELRAAIKDNGHARYEAAIAFIEACYQADVEDGVWERMKAANAESETAP